MNTLLCDKSLHSVRCQIYPFQINILHAQTETSLLSLKSSQPSKLGEEGKPSGFPPPPPPTSLPNVFLFFLSFSLHEETTFSLELALDLSPVFDGLSKTLKNQQLHHPLLSSHHSVVDRHLRYAIGRLFGDLKFVAFKARSTSPHQPPAETRPSSSITGVPASRRPAPCLILMTTRWRVDHTPLRVDLKESSAT